MLDPERDVVEPDGVPAHPLQPHELVDRAVAVDDEVRAHAGALAELDVGRVGGEGVEGGAVGAGGREVLDDHLRLEQPRAVEAVMAAGVGAHLALAVAAERDRRPLDRAAWPPGPPRRGSRAVARGGRAAPRAAWRRAAAGVSAPAGSSTTNAVLAGNVRFCQPGGGAAVRREAAGGQPAAARVGAHLRLVVGAREVHEAHVLVVVDRQLRADPADEAHLARASRAPRRRSGRGSRCPTRGRRPASATAGCG